MARGGVRRKQPSRRPIPAGTRSRPQLPAAWESAGHRRPQLRLPPASPALFIARHVGLLPQPRSRLLLPQPWGLRGGGGGSGGGQTPAQAGETTAWLQGMEQQGGSLAKLATKPYGIHPPAGGCTANPLQRKPLPHPPKKPFPSCHLGDAGKSPPPHPTPSLPSHPMPSCLEWAARLGWRSSGSSSSAREESTCFQAQGNWSTLSFRCL